MKKLLVLLLSLLMIVAFVSCNESSDDPNNQDDPNLLYFTDITFSDSTVTYNGTEQSITILGELPAGATVTYSKNKGTNAGVYNATAKLECEGYNTKTLEATLTINKASYDMSGAKWSYTAPYTYDESLKSVSVSGLPNGVSVKSYTNNEKTNAGEYTAIASFNYDVINYIAPVMNNCNWVINKADITTNIIFDGATVEYDTFEHSLEIVGDIPRGTSVIYKYNDVEASGVVEPGNYNVKAIISGPNHNERVVTATLTIKASEELLYIVNHDGIIYFQNNLDDNKLYKVTSSGVSKINNDKPEYFFSYGDELYYYSSSLFSKSIKKINSAGIVSSVYSVSGDYLTSDGTYVYYAVNNLLFGTDENGIYKIKLDGSEDTPTKLCSTKAAYLTVYDGFVYYSNLSADKYLYRVPATGGTPVVIHEEKVEYIIEDNGILYFDSSKTLGSAIYKYNIGSETTTKITTDSGKYLTKVGNDIYYVNNDLLTGTVFGDGIYKVSVLQSGSLPGTKVISASEGDGYSSLTSDGNCLYYYKLSDKHLYKYDPSNGTEVDLMNNFVPPVEEVTLVGNAVIAEYRGEIYYTNPLDGMLNGACLYKYNPTSGTRVKVLQDDVAGVWFNGDYMYYSTCIATNYALWRMDMKTGEQIKINSDRCENLIFEGNIIYYIKVNAATNNRIMKLDATDLTATPTEIYSAENLSVTGMYKIGDTFYFVKNPKLGYQYIFKYTLGGNTDGINLNIKAKQIVVSSDRIFYYDGTSNSIKSCDLNGNDVKSLVSNVTINDMFLSANKLYFSSTDSTVGLYVYDISTQTKTQISTKVADAIRQVGSNIWFIQSAVDYAADYPVHSGNGDGRLYCYDGTTVSKK